MIRKALALSLLPSLILSGCASSTTTSGNPFGTATVVAATPSTAIQHVVVIFGENISYDHYFATYPNAANSTAGEPKFTAAAGTPIPENLQKAGLLTNNPNASNTANGAGAINPYRLTRAEARTADQDHNYNDEQTAFDGGKMDRFPASVGAADSGVYVTTTPAPQTNSQGKGLTMGYYDGNTVTAFWNYANRYAMNDHSFGTNFGPSTPGAINLVSGQTNGLTNTLALGSSAVPDGNGGQTLVGDADPAGDICSSTSKYTSMTGKNVGDLLNAAGVTWGWFQGGFDLSVTNANGTTQCKRSTVSNVAPVMTVADYVQHHEPFQYYATTSNPNHLRPTSVANIGKNDSANHQYDTHDFTDALAAGNLPTVSFLKAPAYQNAHAGNSDPLDEQTFVVNIVNALQRSQFWANTAVILAYDDSDGWYDHVSNVINGSATTSDTLSGTNLCLSTGAAANALAGADGKPAAQGRCGYGPRLPLIVISPWAKKNFIDSTVTDQSSVLRLIEDLYLGGKRIGNGSFDAQAGSLMTMFDFSQGTAQNSAQLILDPNAGTVAGQ